MHPHQYNVPYHYTLSQKITVQMYYMPQHSETLHVAHTEYL